MSAAVETDYSISHIRTSCDKLDVLRQSQKLADVCFRIDDKCFEAHKIVLAAASPVFLAMFESGMKESLSNEIVLTDTDPEGFNDFLRFVYCGGIPDMKHVVTLLNLADKYHILSLFDLCVAYLEKTLNEVNVSERLQLADLHGVSPLKNACLDFIKDNLESVSCTAGWADVSNNLHLTTLIAQSLRRLPDDAAVPEEVFNVSESNETLCKTTVKTVQWSIKWATVLNHELLRDPKSPTPLKTETFDVTLKNGTSEKFYMYLSKKETRRCGTEVTFWLKLDTTEKRIVDVDCVAVLHSAIPNGEHRRHMKFSFKTNKNPKKSFTWDRQILTFHMSDGHFSIDNAIKLSLIFPQPGDSSIVLESEEKVPKAFPKFTRSDDFTDVAFELNGTIFRAHRIILASHSDVFKDWFHQHSSQSTFTLNTHSSETFDILLNFMYCGRFPEPQSINVDLLHAAVKFGVVDVADFCSLVVAENVTVENSLRLLKISQKRGAEKLKEPVLKFISSNLDEVIASAGWQTLRNRCSVVTDLLLGLSSLRAAPGPGKPSTQEQASYVRDDISIHFKPDIFEKEYEF